MDPYAFQRQAMKSGTNGYAPQRTPLRHRPEGPENENRGRKLKEVAVLKISAKVMELTGITQEFPLYQNALRDVEKALANRTYMDRWPVQQAGKATKAERRASQEAVLEIAGILRQFAESLTCQSDVVRSLLVKLHGALAMVTARFYRKHKANDAVMVKSIFVDVTFNTFIVNTWRIDLTVLRTRFGSFDWANNFDAYRLSKDCREWENPLSLVVNHMELQQLQDKISSIEMQRNQLASENNRLHHEVQTLRSQLAHARGQTPPSVSQSFHFVPGSSQTSSQPGTPQGDSAGMGMFNFDAIPPTIKQDTSVSAPNSLLTWGQQLHSLGPFDVHGLTSAGTASSVGSGRDSGSTNGSVHLGSPVYFDQYGGGGGPGGMKMQPQTQIVLGNNGHALGHVGLTHSSHTSVSAPMVRSLTPSSSTSAPNTPPQEFLVHIMQQQQQQDRHLSEPDMRQHQQPVVHRDFPPQQYQVSLGRSMANVAQNNQSRGSNEVRFIGQERSHHHHAQPHDHFSTRSMHQVHQVNGANPFLVPEVSEGVRSAQLQLAQTLGVLGNGSDLPFDLSLLPPMNQFDGDIDMEP